MGSSARASPVVAFGGLAAVLVLNFWVLGLPTALQPLTPAGASVYSTATLVLLGCAAGMLALWSAVRPFGDVAERPAWLGAAAIGLIGAAGLAIVATQWVARIRLIPIEPTRADMVPLIQLALERFLEGRNPYTLYQLPWTLPLSYGPWLWLAFLPAHVLGADLRLTTVFGQLFVPALAVVAAVAEGSARRYLQAGVLCALAVAVAFNPLFLNFVDIGHTPAYFPLLAAFGLAMTTRSHRAAAVLLGSLVVARSLYVALVPVLLLYVWYQDRRRIVPVLLLVGAAAGLPFLPFLLLDWRMVWLGMYGTYVSVIKEFVWQQPNPLADTVGLTRVLLARGYEAYVELSQLIVMAAVYASVWVAIRRGARPEPWMCAALLAMCMTTLWPVWYIFLDVFVLGVVFFMGQTVSSFRTQPRVPLAASVAVAVVLTVAAAWLR